jgi:hypothetical protein
MDDAALSELQAWLAAVLRRRRALPADPELARLAREHVTGNDRLAPVEQLEIYREQFWLRHTGSLIEDFPGLGGILGQSGWERLLEEYLLAHPPASFTLRDLGQELPDFVARADWLENRELCADMARLEWAYLEAFDAADCEPLAPAALAAIPEAAWESARLELAPSLRLLELDFPVADLRRAIRGEQLVKIPARQPTKLAVHRLNRELFDRKLPDVAFALLSRLAQGLSLGAACEQVAEATPGLEASLGDWFRQWAELGWIARVVVP